MKTVLQNPFIACDRSSPPTVAATSSAGTLEQGRPATVSPGVLTGLCPPGEIDPSVMLDWAPGEASSCGGMNAHQSRERCADNKPAFSEAVEVASDPHDPNTRQLCIAKAYGGEWCIGRCLDPKDCSGVPARKALMKAVNAVEELPNFKANLKTDVAS